MHHLTINPLAPPPPSIKNLIVRAVTSSWKCWIPAHTINFAFVPPDLMILYINMVQIGFNCFLSMIGSEAVKEVSERRRGGCYSGPPLPP